MSRPKGKKNPVKGSKIVEAPLELPYVATLSTYGRVFSASGLTIAGAIGNITPGTIRGKAILTLSRNGKSKERVLMPVPTMRLFNTSGLSREIQLKSVASLFQGFDV